jgi:methyl-accepting chemotaxis protein
LAVAERRSSAGWVRVVTAVLLATAVLVPMATVAAWASSDNSDARSRIESERRGVEYLRPLSDLLGALVGGQSAAVRGEQVDNTQLEAALAKVELIEVRNGAELSTRARWPILRDSIKELIRNNGSPGQDAYQRWAQAVDLTVALIRRVGDTSLLFVDSEVDSSYLIDAGLLRLPEIIQAAGQLADLGQMTPGLRADDARAAVLRDRIATSAAQVATGLGNVADASGSGRLGSSLLSPLDQFGAATDALAPSVAVASMPPLPDNLTAAAVGVRESSQRLAQTIWAELDRLLVSRLDDLSNRRIQILAVAVLGLLVAVAVGVALLVFTRRTPAPRRRSPAHAAPEDPTPPDQGASLGASLSATFGTDQPGHLAGQYAGPGTDPAVAAVVGPPRPPAGVR